MINLSETINGNDIISYFYYNDTTNYKSNVDVFPSSNLLDGWGTSEVLLNPTLNRAQKGYNWCSTNSVNSSVTIRFFNHRIRLYSYTIRQNCFNGNHHFNTWNFEGSEDGINWILIDQKADFVEPSFYKQCGSVNVTIPQHFYRNFRFTLTGHTSWSNYHFIISRIELFGELWSLSHVENKLINSCFEASIIYSICSIYIYFILFS